MGCRHVGLIATAVLLPLAACGPPEAGSGNEAAAGDSASEAAPHVAASSPVEAGAFLVRVVGCNDCHTAGYLDRQGEVPRSERLTG